MACTATYHLQLRLRLLQQWRMLQALTESDVSFSVPLAQKENVEFLRKYFDIPLSFTDDADVAGHLLQLSTSKPWCAIAGIRRTLIYPHHVLNYCRGLWEPSRDIRFGFAGFAHSTRHKVMDEWHKRWFGVPLVPIRLRHGQELSRYLSGDHFASAAVVYSKAGRRFPGKLWDDAYYNFLANSTMTLCPDGEEIWTYRFFEAMLCGSVPIVQSDCAVYRGFRYGYFGDDPSTIDCSPEVVLHNFRLCRERLTIPVPDLNEALFYELR